jgi:hypothetical protein
MPDDRTKLNLPARPFLYTLDQIGTILSIEERSLKRNGMLFFVGRQPGRPLPDELRTVNVASGTDAPPEWRVEERELIRWMKRKGFTYVDR